jgi:serine/threonine-protein kinase RIO1
MKEHGMRCPTPILGREHIVIMTFCGKDGIPAPHLKVVAIPPTGIFPGRM